MIAHTFIENLYHCVGTTTALVLLSLKLISDTSTVQGAAGGAGGAMYLSHVIMTFCMVPSVNVISTVIGHANVRPSLSKNP